MNIFGFVPAATVKADLELDWIYVEPAVRAAAAAADEDAAAALRLGGIARGTAAGGGEGGGVEGPCVSGECPHLLRIEGLALALRASGAAMLGLLACSVTAAHTFNLPVI